MLVKGAVSDITTKAEYHPKAEFKARKLFSYASFTIGATKGHYDYVKREVFALIAPLNRPQKAKLVNDFSQVFNEFGFAKAYKRLKRITAPVHQIINDSLFDDYLFLHDADKRQQLADQLAANCYNQVVNFSKQSGVVNCDYEESVLRAYQHICEFTAHFNITPKYNPYPKKRLLTVDEAQSGLLRFFDGDYWLNHFDHHAKRVNEHIAIALGYVNKKHAPYVSNEAFGNYKSQVAANNRYLSLMDAVSNETGERFNLADLVAQTSSNPEKRRIELMVRCRGMEEIAKKNGYDALFLTVTAPSKYHKHSTKWNGYNPKQTNKHLCKLWARIRAEFARQGIDYQGVRVCEPHADATPHWHLLIFVKPHQKRLLTTITRQYVTDEDRQELIKSHKKHLFLVSIGKSKTYRPKWYSPRFTCELIDPERGSATGYIAKYIAKNINGEKMQGQIDDETNRCVVESACRVTAWASLWGVRQFQFFGVASVSVWRACRRVRDPFGCEDMERVRKAADKGCWQEFSEYMAQTPLTLVYEIKQEVNQYHEPIKKVSGVALAGIEEITCGMGFYLESRKASWTRVNNCTDTSLSDREKKILFDIGLSLEDFALMRQGATISKGEKIRYRLRNGQITEVRA